MERRKFQVNDYITLRLENGKTIIYVDGKRFRQCKYLVFQLNRDELHKYDKFDSIDKIEEKDRSSTYKNIDITPEAEFWGHCSNLQAWAEHNYDTKLLHKSLAFPLLKTLNRAGDQKARIVFKEEIAFRFLSGHNSVVLYLLEGGYLELLNKDELKSLVYSNEMEKLSKKSIKSFLPKLSNYFKLNDKFPKTKTLVVDLIKRVFEEFENIEDIRSIIKEGYIENLKEKELETIVHALNINKLYEYPKEDILFILSNFFKYNVSKTKLLLIRLIKRVFEALNDRELVNYIIKEGYIDYLSEDEINNLINTLNITKIKRHSLYDIIWLLENFYDMGREMETLSGALKIPLYEVKAINMIEIKLNKTFELVSNINWESDLVLKQGLKGIEGIGIYACGLSSFPKSLLNFQYLKRIELYGNNLGQIPDSINNLKSLRELELGGNQLSSIPESIGRIQSLEILKLYRNQINTLPESLIELPSLKLLHIINNPLDEKAISILKKLQGKGVYIDMTLNKR